MTMLKLKVAGLKSTGLCGKKLSMKIKLRNKTAMMFIGRPSLPKSQRRGRRGSPRRRLIMMQVIDTMYEHRSAPVASDVMMLKAAAEPRLMREINMAKT